MWSRALALLAILSSLGLAAEPLRVASWNVNQARDSAQILAALEQPQLSAAGCDLLVLQEAPFGESPSLAESIARERGWHVFQNASNAILSRWPIRRSGVAVIGVSRTRELPWADIDAPLGPLRVYSIHLTFRNGGLPFEEELRFQELAWILYHLEKTEPPASPETPVLLAGDFNTVGSIWWGHQREKALRLLARRGFVSGPGNGATHLLFGRLDWIWASRLRPLDGGVGEFDGADHRWLWASFKPAGSEHVPTPRISGVSGVWPVLGLVVVVVAVLGARRVGRARRR